MTLHSVQAPAAGECVQMSLGVAAALRQHALARHPQECCGILVGRLRAPTEVQSVQPVGNSHPTRPAQRYQIDPRQIFRLDRMVRDQTLEIIGFYHSHPRHPAVPSSTDLAHAWPGYLYVIVGLPATGEAEIRAWMYDEDTVAFQERPIVMTGLTPSNLYWGSRHAAGSSSTIRGAALEQKEVSSCQ